MLADAILALHLLSASLPPLHSVNPFGYSPERGDIRARKQLYLIYWPGCLVGQDGMSPRFSTRDLAEVHVSHSVILFQVTFGMSSRFISTVRMMLHSDYDLTVYSRRI